MEWFNLPLIALALLLTGWLLLRRHRRRSPQKTRLSRTEQLLSADERNFLEALEQAVGPQHRVVCKVRMAAVVGPAERLDHRQWQRVFAAVRDRHFDFLVCDAQSYAPLCAVALDGGKGKDPLLDRICEQSQLPLLYFASHSHYVAAEIGLQFDRLFAADDPIPELRIGAIGSADCGEGVARLGPARPEEPSCPECGAPMKLRRATGDFQVEQAFWLCGLPECRKRVSLEKRQPDAGAALDGLVP